MADEETFLDLAAAERHAWAASEYDGQCVTCALVNALRWSREDADEGDQIRSKMSTLLSRTAVALNGPEPADTRLARVGVPVGDLLQCSYVGPP